MESLYDGVLNSYRYIIFVKSPLIWYSGILISCYLKMILLLCYKNMYKPKNIVYTMSKVRALVINEPSWETKLSFLLYLNY